MSMPILNLGAVATQNNLSSPFPDSKANICDPNAMLFFKIFDAATVKSKPEDKVEVPETDAEDIEVDELSAQTDSAESSNLNLEMVDIDLLILTQEKSGFDQLSSVSTSADPGSDEVASLVVLRSDNGHSALSLSQADNGNRTQIKVIDYQADLEMRDHINRSQLSSFATLLEKLGSIDKVLFPTDQAGDLEKADNLPTRFIFDSMGSNFAREPTAATLSGVMASQLGGRPETRPLIDRVIQKSGAIEVRPIVVGPNEGSKLLNLRDTLEAIEPPVSAPSTKNDVSVALGSRQDATAAATVIMAPARDAITSGLSSDIEESIWRTDNVEASVGPADRLRSAPHVTSAGSSTGAMQAQNVAQQMAVSVQSTKDGVTELTLRPEELGNVKIRMIGSESAMSVVLIIDRPETADLMRRHADVLAQEFRSLGYQNLTFSFGNGSQSSGRPSQPDEARSPGLLGGEPQEDGKQQPTISTANLDLRL